MASLAPTSLFDMRLGSLNTSFYQFATHLYDDFNLSPYDRSICARYVHAVADSISLLRSSLYDLCALRMYLDSHAIINGILGDFEDEKEKLVKLFETS